MPENDYIEQIKEVSSSYNEQIEVLEEANEKIRQRLEEIRENNNKFREEQQKQADYYDVNWSDIDIDSEHVFTVKDENGNEQILRYIVSERNQLNEELTNNNRMIGILESFRNDEISQIKKKIREENLEETNRNSLLNEAYKFFTYLDTSTTKGYDVSGLTESEVIALYKQFYDNREKPGYSRIWSETTERMKKDDRKIVIPTKDDITEEIENVEEPEVFGPPTPDDLKDLEEPNPNSQNPDSSDETNEQEPTEPIEKPADEELTEPIEEEPEEIEEEPLIKGEEKQKGKWDKFKDWAKKNKNKLIIAGLVVGGLAVTGSIVVGLVSAGVMNSVVNVGDSPTLVSANTSDSVISSIASTISDASQNVDNDVIEQYINGNGDISTGLEETDINGFNPSNINDIGVGTDISGVASENGLGADNASASLDGTDVNSINNTVTAQTQMHDNTVHFGQSDQIFTSSDNASLGQNGEVPYYDTVYEVDMANPVTHEYAGVNPAELTEAEYQQYLADGFKPLTSVDPNMAQYDGSTVAAQNMATGFTSGKTL